MKPREMTAVEQKIAAIWTEILRVDDVELDDDFFELGGDSLMLINVVMTMGERFGVPLDTSIVVEGATVASLASCAERLITERLAADRGRIGQAAVFDD